MHTVIISMNFYYYELQLNSSNLLIIKMKSQYYVIVITNKCINSKLINQLIKFTTNISKN